MIRLFDQNLWHYRVVADRVTLVRKMVFAYDADICTFQECRAITHRVGEGGIAALLASKYDEVEPSYAERNFTPIFYRRERFDVLASGYELYEGFNDINSKSLTWAVLEDRLEGGRFAIVSTHFWWKSVSEEDFAQRIANVHQLHRRCERIVSEYGVPVIVAGDLNCGKNSAQGEEPCFEMERLGFANVRKHAKRTTDRHTIHAVPVLNEETGKFETDSMPTRTLDHVYSYNGERLEFASFNVLLEQEARNSSDHCPLLVELSLKKARDPFVNFAHRGASEYAPENTMSSFCLGLRMGANGIETDVQITRDGVLVLFHDDTLARVTAREGEIKDYTYDELTQMRVRNAKTGEEDIIVRFEDFLRYFGWRDLTFAIELKKPGYEKEVLEMMDRFHVREKSVITSFKFACIERVKELRPDYKVGWLIKDFDEEKNGQLRRIGGEQICPQAKYLTKEKIAAWRALGFESVRAWGVTDSELMKMVYDCGADGMTVNFPDLLTAYIDEKNA